MPGELALRPKKKDLFVVDLLVAVTFTCHRGAVWLVRGLWLFWLS